MTDQLQMAATATSTFIGLQHSTADPATTKLALGLQQLAQAVEGIARQQNELAQQVRNVDR
jgi:hypothetical protein